MEIGPIKRVVRVEPQVLPREAPGPIPVEPQRREKDVPVEQPA